VRITVQLIETATGHHLFAERYDRGIADVFAVQDEIAERIVASIEPEIHRAEARRAARKYPADLDAWDHSLKALALQERMNPSGHIEARKHLECALKSDPTSARAWSLLSLCHYHEGILGWASDRAASLRLSRDAADQAVAHDDREWLAHALWGMGRLWTERDFASALEGEETAVALNPSAPMARHGLACIFEFSGRPAEALPISRRFSASIRVTASVLLPSQIKASAIYFLAISTKRSRRPRRPFVRNRETSGRANGSLRH